MPIYDKPVRLLIRDMISALATKRGQQFSKDGAIEWFTQHYPKIKEGTISAHLIRFSTNAPSRLHYSVRTDEDLLFQIDGSHFRLYDPATDPPPIHSKSDATVLQENLVEPGEAQSSGDLPMRAIFEIFSARTHHISSPVFNSIKTRALRALNFLREGASSTYLPWTQRSASWSSN
jgi:hypothetical protein